MENHLLHLGWFSARTFGTVLPETGTVKFINNFPLLITFLAENITKLGFPPWCHTKHNITIRNRHILVSNQQYSETPNCYVRAVSHACDVRWEKVGNS